MRILHQDPSWAYVRLTGDSNKRSWKIRLHERISSPRVAAIRPRTCDIRIWAEPKGTAIVRCGLQAVCCHVVRYRLREVEEGQHVVGDFTVPSQISLAVPCPTTIRVETFNTGGIIDFGHRGRESGSQTSNARVAYKYISRYGLTHPNVTHSCGPR